jgi:hypothetical protein
MRYLDQYSFCESDDRNLDAHPLVIHRRKNKLDNDALILFVHGLTGRRYGYWGQFCHFVFNRSVVPTELRPVDLSFPV